MLSPTKIHFDTYLYSVVFFCFSLPQFSFTQIDGLPPNPVPGFCYERVISPPVFAFWEEEYPVFIGEKTPDINLDIVTLVLVPKHHTVEIRPNLVICEISHEAVKEQVIYVADTTQTNEYLWETFTLSELIDQGGEISWVRSLCGKGIPPDYYDLEYYCRILSELGYFTGDCDTEEINPGLKAAFLKFQSDKRIPGKEIQIKTLDVLEEEY